MNVLILDGHPDDRRLVSNLLDHYAVSLGADATVQRIAVRDLAFDPNLRRGYATDQAWEPDLERVGAALDACDHLVPLHRGFDCLSVSRIERGQVGMVYLDGDAPSRARLA